jgi:hypothetical protein
MELLAPYVLYLVGAAGSSVWIYRDATKREHASPRGVTLAAAVFFPIGLLIYVLSR